MGDVAAATAAFCETRSEQNRAVDRPTSDNIAADSGKAEIKYCLRRRCHSPPSFLPSFLPSLFLPFPFSALCRLMSAARLPSRARGTTMEIGSSRFSSRGKRRRRRLSSPLFFPFPDLVFCPPHYNSLLRPNWGHREWTPTFLDGTCSDPTARAKSL